MSTSCLKERSTRALGFRHQLLSPCPTLQWPTCRAPSLASCTVTRKEKLLAQSPYTCLGTVYRTTTPLGDNESISCPHLFQAGDLHSPVQIPIQSERPAVKQLIPLYRLPLHKEQPLGSAFRLTLHSDLS